MQTVGWELTWDNYNDFEVLIFRFSSLSMVDISFEGIKYTDMKHGVLLHNGGWNDTVYVVGWWPVYCTVSRPGQYPLSRHAATGGFPQVQVHSGGGQQ